MQKKFASGLYCAGDGGMQSKTESIGYRLRQARIHIGLTLKEAAAEIGYAESTLSAIETGRNRPSERLLREVSKTFGINYKWLSNGAGEMLLGGSGFVPHPAVDQLREALHALTEAIKSAEVAIRSPPAIPLADVKPDLTIGAAPSYSLGRPTMIPTEKEALIEFRQRLNRALAKAGAKSKLARELGVSRQAVSQWATGATSPDAGKLLRVLAWVRANEAG